MSFSLHRLYAIVRQYNFTVLGAALVSRKESALAPNANCLRIVRYQLKGRLLGEAMMHRIESKKFHSNRSARGYAAEADAR